MARLAPDEIGDDREGAVHGRSLHFVRMGKPLAGTILFIHGITESRRYFSRPMAPLAKEFELVIPDLPGFGLSPKPATRYSMDLFRDSVRSFVVHHELADKPLFIVGHSLGSLIGLEYAASYPEHIRRLALLNLPRHFSKEEAHGIFWNGSPSYRRLLHQHSVRASFGQLRRTGVTMSLRYARHFPWSVLLDARKFTFLSLTSTLENCLLDYRVDAILDRVPHVPTLLLHGERDQVAPFANIRGLPESHPWMRLVSIPSSGHHILHTHGLRVLGEIRHFLLAPGG